MKKIDFLPNLFIAYLRAIYHLDNDGKHKKLDNYEVTEKIKCMPRDKDGKIHNIMVFPQKTNDAQLHKSNIYDEMIKIPVDPTGGFFIPSYKTRDAYFALRTVFYRSLWNYRFVCAENTKKKKHTKKV